MSTQRRKIVAGNWKMNTTPAEGTELINNILALKDAVDCELIIAVPFTHLSDAIKSTNGTNLKIAAQNCANHASGAYTGEVSAHMISSMGVEYVILGHSERREYYGENSEILSQKIQLAYANNLKPIYCVGEKLDERESEKHFDVVKSQLTEVLKNITHEQFEQIIIAYEPVWAIGTGKTASADQAQEIHHFIRKTLADMFTPELAERTPILYGGSCKPSNAGEIFAKTDVDGGLIGGAALVANDFIAIGKAF